MSNTGCALAVNCTACVKYINCTKVGSDSQYLGICNDFLKKGVDDIIKIKESEERRELGEINSVYARNVGALLDRQLMKGKSKYGELLEDNNTLSSEQRIEHLEEELIDGLMYCQHIKAAINDNLTANDYQRMAMRTAEGMDHSIIQNGLLINGVMGLNGEAGECIDIVKKSLFQGHELDKEHLIEELGDCAWYLAVSCEALGVSFEEVMLRNIEKLKNRYPEGFDKSRSINRAE